jgi:hypothetical protein
MKMRGFFDLGGSNPQEHVGVPLRLRRALRPRVEAPSFKPLQKCEGFFDLGGLNTQEHAGVPLRLRRAFYTFTYLRLQPAFIYLLLYHAKRIQFVTI